MDGNRSREALGQFLEWAGDKGLMARATAQARQAAAAKLLGILEPAEANDVTGVDVDDVVSRFNHLHGKKYTRGSLNTYRSRLRSSLDDFRSYLNNPLAFRPSIQRRERPKAKGDGESTPSSRSPSSEQRPETTRPNLLPVAAGNIMPIAIRSDLTIFVQGLPFDLTETEARKIAAVVMAMAES
ncbi:MAG: hypothetical protein M3T55_12510 [Pseudomonadota bacterium]|nr:hypothetical protein [Pseudomonadota bacterium]